MKIVAAAIIIATLSGCMKVPEDVGPSTMKYVGNSGNKHSRVHVYIDKQHNVICYAAYGDGISCLPYNDEGTHLEIVQ